MIGEKSHDRRAISGRPPVVVLVVDDSKAVRLLLARTLRANGFKVTEAANGQEALTSCVVERPDLILLDIDMPVMSGLEVLRRLTADPDAYGMPVLMLTARTTGPDVARALELGAQDYLKKPCSSEELIARVRTAQALQDRHEALFRRADELGQISSTDPLTELGNRRAFTERVSAMITERGGETEVAILMLDLDHFKAVNDTHGHLAGDEVLSGLARRLREVCGDRGLAIRWGGEEFVVLVSEPDQVDFSDLAEAIRAAVADEPFASDSGVQIPVTISVGVARGRLDHLREVLAAADEAVYRAKAGGRNQVAAAPS